MSHRASLRMPPDFVIRPSGVWNSRSPFHDYLMEYKRLLRGHNALTLAVLRLRQDSEDPDVATKGARKWLRTEQGPHLGGIAWRNYKKSIPRLVQNEPPTVSVAMFADDLDKALFDVRRNTVIAYSGLFELFTQSLALNVLLARLESGQGWTALERRLAVGFSPEHGKGDLPTVPRILAAFPELERGLRDLPMVLVKSELSSEVPVTVDDVENLYEAIRFWRALRNILVHRSGMVSASFVRRHGELYERLRGHYTYLEALGSGRFRLYEDIVRAMGAVHYRAAHWMNNRLLGESGERRGHPLAPEPKQEEFFSAGMKHKSPPLLMDGDHAMSLTWLAGPLERTILRDGGQLSDETSPPFDGR